MRPFAVLAVILTGCVDGDAAFEAGPITPHGCATAQLSAGFSFQEEADGLTVEDDALLLSGAVYDDVRRGMRPFVEKRAWPGGELRWRWRGDLDAGAPIAVVRVASGYDVFTGRGRVHVDVLGQTAGRAAWVPGAEAAPAGLPADAGGFYAWRGGELVRFDPEGEARWAAALPAGRWRLGPAEDGGVAAWDVAERRVARIDAGGHVLWTVDAAPDTRAFDVAGDGEGGVVAAGVRRTWRAEPWIARWGADGRLLWSRALAAAAPGDHAGWRNASVWRVARTGEGFVFAGKRCGHPDRCEVWHGALDAAGDVTAESTLRRDNLEEVHALATRPDGEVVVLGSRRDCCGDAFGGERYWLLGLRPDGTCAP